MSASDSLPPIVAARLNVKRDNAYDTLSTLLESVSGRDFTHAESIEHSRLVRRIAVISFAFHRHNPGALTDDERRWLAAQGVEIQGIENRMTEDLPSPIFRGGGIYFRAASGDGAETLPKHYAW